MQGIKEMFSQLTLTKLERVVFQTLCVMALMNIVCLATHSITGSVEGFVFIIAAVAAVVATVTFVTAILADAVATIAASIVAAVAAVVAVAVVAVVADGFTIISIVSIALALVISIAFLVPAVYLVTSDHDIKWWKAFLVFFVEGALLFFCFSYFVPIASLVLLCATGLTLVVWIISIGLNLKEYKCGSCGENWPTEADKTCWNCDSTSMVVK